MAEEGEDGGIERCIGCREGCSMSLLTETMTKEKRVKEGRNHDADDGQVVVRSIHMPMGL